MGADVVLCATSCSRRNVQVGPTFILIGGATMLRRTVVCLALPCLFWASACGDSATAPLTRMAAPNSASFSIADGAHGGSTRFYFLPPLVSNPKIGPANDEAVYPALTVTVCALSGSACAAGDPLVRYIPSNNASGKGDCQGASCAGNGCGRGASATP